ncbi:hypothetical protein LOAG_15881 [Loa loa]|nr:hypothetical protein LOAG_15881 [Loa loa]EFO12652.1 hypothetical protein LOAG_15881 [Loa loa]
MESQCLKPAEGLQSDAMVEQMDMFDTIDKKNDDKNDYIENYEEFIYSDDSD